MYKCYFIEVKTNDRGELLRILRDPINEIEAYVCHSDENQGLYFKVWSSKEINFSNYEITPVNKDETVHTDEEVLRLCYKIIQRVGLNIKSIEELCGIVMHYLCNMSVLGPDAESRLFKLLSEKGKNITVSEDHGWELNIRNDGQIDNQ
jgi:hypothetical protein